MNIQSTRKLMWAMTLLVLVVALGIGFWPKPTPVEMATATVAPLRVTIVEEGKSRVIDRYIVAAPVTGTMCRVQWDVGDQVVKSQRLLTIEPLHAEPLDARSQAGAEARIKAARAALHAAEQAAFAARAETALAETELARVVPLVQQGHLAQEKLDQAQARTRTLRASLRSAEFSVDVAQHELEATQSALRYTGADGRDDLSQVVEVLAPVSGRILKIQQECEGVVTAGQPLLEIGDTDSLEIETEVLSADAVKIKPGMQVVYERWGGGTPLSGVVRRVEPVGFTQVSALGVDEQRVLVISDLMAGEVQQPHSLGDGYRVESHFVIWADEAVLQIPASALFRVDDRWAVFTVQVGKARRRMVDVGQQNGLRAQILNGLSPNDTVITHPDDTVEEGIRIVQR